MVAASYVERNDVSFLPSLRIHVPYAHEAVEHVGDAAVISELLVGDVATGTEVPQPCLTLAVWVAVPHLIDVVSLSLSCSLAVIKRYEVLREVCHDGVAHHEILINLLGGFCYEAGAKAFPAVVHDGLGDHGCRASLDPYELPVEVEVVVYSLVAREGLVVVGTLSLREAQG